MKQEMMGWQWHQLTTCKSFAPRSTQITTQAPRHSSFYRLDALPDARPNQQCQSTDKKSLQEKVGWLGFNGTFNTE